MTTNRNRRLTKEIADITVDKQSGIVVTDPQGNDDFTDFTHFKGIFMGPPDTPYEGGKYEIDIHITSDYPFKPPEMRFITRIWHPNVSSQTGAICLDTLGKAWSPVLTLKSALISLQSLLSDPEPRDPQDAEVASMLLTNAEQFKHVAREWAIKYAGATRAPPGSGRTGAGTSTAGATDEATVRARQDAEETERRKRERRSLEAYQGYNRQLVERFTDLGFSVRQVVTAFQDVGLDAMDGEFYEIDAVVIEDITAILFEDS